ncbi:MAG: ABC transporter permease subunit [Pseudomonadota bacterium]
MTAIPDQGNEPFQLSQLIYDTRYRSLTIQFIAIIAVVLFFGWLISNAITNLAAQGQDIDFAFFGSPAGYDISMSLIDYNSQSTHLRAAFVGLFNTLLVSILAIISATIVGTIAGVLRLSNNWLISKLMSIYVEIFRNVPLLVWILIIFGVTINIFPQPRAFRGADPQASMWFSDSVAFTNRGVYIPKPIWESGSAIVVAVFLLSIIGIFVFRRYARNLLYKTGTLLPVGWISLGIFVVPTAVVFVAMGTPISLEYPALRGFNFQGGIQVLGSLIALWFALTVYTGAFIAENVRAGIMAISKGQTEAAGALGLRPGRIMNLVVLPQALRVIIPPLISQFLNITKNSSLAIAVGYPELTATLGGITLNQTGRAMECVLLLMLFYVSISLSISFLMNIYNNAVKLKER